jgi:hypothetical protein
MAAIYGISDKSGFPVNELPVHNPRGAGAIHKSGQSKNSVIFAELLRHFSLICVILSKTIRHSVESRNPRGGTSRLDTSLCRYDVSKFSVLESLNLVFIKNNGYPLKSQ